MGDCVIIPAWSRRTVDGHSSPKNYPYWKDLILSLRDEGYDPMQVLSKGEEALTKIYFEDPSFEQLLELLKGCKTWISVDNFFPHFAHYYNKPGFVLWGPSDENIFGYKDNYNLRAPNSTLKKNQWELWSPNDKSEFLKPDEVIKAINEKIRG